MIRFSDATNRYLIDQNKVEGWLFPTASHTIAALLAYQREISLIGNVMEIGVHHGRLFIILALGIGGKEHALAIDLFDLQEQNVDRSGKGDFGALGVNLAAHAPNAQVKFLQANSLELGAEFCSANRGMRFISVDGGHTRECTENDLWIAERVAREGAIVALDDIYRLEWSGVTAGLASYYRHGGNLVPIAIIPNKVLLTTSVDWADRYRGQLAAGFNVGAEQQFFDFNRVTIVPHDHNHEPANFAKALSG